MSAFLAACSRRSRRGIGCGPRLHKDRALVAISMRNTKLLTDLVWPHELIRTNRGLVSGRTWIDSEVDRRRAKGVDCKAITIGNKLAVCHA